MKLKTTDPYTRLVPFLGTFRHPDFFRYKEVSTSKPLDFSTCIRGIDMGNMNVYLLLDHFDLELTYISSVQNALVRIIYVMLPRCRRRYNWDLNVNAKHISTLWEEGTKFWGTSGPLSPMNSGQMPSVMLMTRHTLKYTCTKQLCSSPSLTGEENKDIQRQCSILSSYNCVHLFYLMRNMHTGENFWDSQKSYT